MFHDPFETLAPPGLKEFRRAMSGAVSSGADVWILTKAGERVVGEVESMSASSEDQDLFGLEVTVPVRGLTLVYQEIESWTVGLAGEPDDVLVDASILQVLDLQGPMNAEDLVVALATCPAPVWCTEERAKVRLAVLEAESRVRHSADEPPVWSFQQRR
jgi:hypothetical protein